MSDTNFPADLLDQRPRKVSVSRTVDRFLDEHSLKPSHVTALRNDTRPSADNVNSMHCTACGKVEYLSRDYCRCGHYLRGQLEDEYLVWERQIHADYKELSELIEARLKPLRYLILLIIVFMLIPTLQMTLWPDSFSLKTLIWILPALLIGSIVVLAEKILSRPLLDSAWYVENYTFEFFLDDRRPCPEKSVEEGKNCDEI